MWPAAKPAAKPGRMLSRDARLASFRASTVATTMSWDYRWRRCMNCSGRLFRIVLFVQRRLEVTDSFAHTLAQLADRLAAEEQERNADNHQCFCKTEAHRDTSSS